MVATLDKRRRLEMASEAAAVRAGQRRGVTEFYLWCLALFIQLQPFDILLTGHDPLKPGAGEGSHRGDWLREAVGAVALLIFLSSKKNRINYLKAFWPFLGFCAVGVMSCVVNPDKFWTFKTLAVYVLSASTAMAMSFRLKPIGFARAALYVFLAGVVLSALAALAVPSFGVMSRWGALSGGWRGVFVHKNNLGHLSGLALVLSLIYGRALLRKSFLPPLLQPAAWLFCIAVCALCLVEAKSSGAILVAAALLSAYVAVVWPRGIWRYITVILTTIVFSFLLSFREEIASSTLKLLGKSEDLTGRSEIWSFTIDGIMQHPLLGGGVGYTASAAYVNRLKALFGIFLTHNNYLDTIANVGVLGLGALMFAAAHAFWTAWSKTPTRVETGRSDFEIARGCFSLTLLAWIIGASSETSIGVFGQLCFIGMFGLWGCAYAAARAPAPRVKAAPAVRRPEPRRRTAPPLQPPAEGQA